MENSFWDNIQEFLYSIYDWSLYYFNETLKFLSNLFLDFSSSNIEEKPIIHDKTKPIETKPVETKPQLRFDEEKPVLDYIKEDNIKLLFEHLDGSKTSKINFNSNEVELLINYIKDLQPEFNPEDAEQFIITDSITFQPVRNKIELTNSLLINKDILENQIKDRVLERFGYDKELHGNCMVLIPFLAKGHFHLLKLSLSFNKDENNEVDFFITKAAFIDTLISTGQDLKTVVNNYLTLLNNEMEVYCSFVNTREQTSESYSCGPRVVRRIIEYLGLYELEKGNEELQAIKGLSSGHELYKKMIYLLKQAYEAQENKNSLKESTCFEPVLNSYSSLEEGSSTSEIPSDISSYEISSVDDSDSMSSESDLYSDSGEDLFHTGMLVGTLESMNNMISGLIKKVPFSFKPYY